MGPLGNKVGLTKSRDMLITSRDRIQELKSDLLMKNTVSRVLQLDAVNTKELLDQPWNEPLPGGGP
jgi:hypothetical protein